jgi:hypothetical protein
MTERIEEATRKQVAEFLPRAIEKALGSYYDYLENPPEPKPNKKGEIQSETSFFKEYHAAGKVAISHIKLLLDMARWADLPVGDTGRPVFDLSQIMTLRNSVATEMSVIKPEEEEDDDLA